MTKLNKKQVMNFVKYVAFREKKKLTKPNLEVWSGYLNDFEFDRYIDTKRRVYVSFHNGDTVERMWVDIQNGDKEKGEGFLLDKPVVLKDLSIGDYVLFEKNPNGKNVCAMDVFNEFRGRKNTKIGRNNNERLN